MKGIITILMLISPALAMTQTSTVFDDLSMKSEILNMERKYAIYLPPDYETSQRSYPVLYLLHGAGGDHRTWVQSGEVQHITDKGINSGKVTPMIIVMPDAGEASGIRGYINDPAGEWRYEDFFFNEFLPYIENTYRIKSKKRYRAISGLSMGGGGTFHYALHRPDLFQSACPLSAAARTIDRDRIQVFMNRRGMAQASEEQIDQWVKKYDIHGLIENMPEDQKKAVRWYIDCGDDDFLYEGNSLVHISMRKNEIPHEYRVRDGQHTWTYWRQALPDVLNFVSIGFHAGVD
jgi:enterochelin esterase-like enzyme